MNIFAQATNKRDKKIVLPFYSMPEYEQWKESLGGNASGWSIKYYKVCSPFDESHVVCSAFCTRLYIFLVLDVIS